MNEMMYPEKEINVLPEKTVTALAAELLTLKGAAVLDVGCGVGAFTCFLAECGARVSGIDPNETRIESARETASEKGLDIDYRVGVGEDLPFEDGAFDIVIYSNSLHHVPGDVLAQALEESARVLAGGGVLYVMEPVPSGPSFEVSQPVTDELDIRTLAYELVCALDGGAFQGMKEIFASTPKRYRNFEDYLRKNLIRNPQRAALFDEQRDELERRFMSLGRAVADGIVLDAAVRLNVLRKAG
jgi:ubiquinone/menaquinone biosynthesis C-methylase UbiE